MTVMWFLLMAVACFALGWVARGLYISAYRSNRPIHVQNNAAGTVAYRVEGDTVILEDKL